MKHISLFSGIGGFELASQWMKWDNVASCDINEFGNKVRAHYWPNSYHHKDIKTLTGEILNNEITKRFGSDWSTDTVILTGGFPCQPFSQAGKRKGTEDERHLWPEMLRIIREIAPDYIVGENVFGLLSWDKGLVFEQVCFDLEREGYQVAPVVIPAAAVNAPHGRDRIWFVAYSKNNGRQERRAEIDKRKKHISCNRSKVWNQSPTIGKQRPFTYTNLYGQFGDFERSKRFYSGYRRETLGFINGISWKGFTPDSDSFKFTREYNGQPRKRQLNRFNSQNATTNSDSRRQSRKEYGQKKTRWTSKKSIPDNWENFPTQSPVCGGNDGIPDRLDSITFPKWRNESIKAYGNAVVPQVVLQIFKAIEKTKTI
jgi:DNA (cytosine-5)-methyltransferase 1